MSITELPQDSESLRKLLIEQLEKNQNFEAEIERLKELLLLSQHKRFAPSSEKLTPDQLGLFNEFEQESKAHLEESDEEADETTEVKAYTRVKGGRKKLPENLHREEVVIEIPESERICPCLGQPMEKIGAAISEKLDVIPMQIKVIRTIRHKYACSHCEEGVKTSPNPPQAIPKSIASEGVLAAIATWKYVDHLPLYRIEAMFKRHGVEVTRGSMAHWMIKTGELIQPIMNLLQENLLSSAYLQMDETRVQVLKEDGKTAQSRSYMWVRARPGPEPIILFEYDPTRQGEVATRLLEGFSGKLQVDGYGGYNEIEVRDGIIRYGCMAHARRRFHDAKKASKKGGLANKALAYIQKLYRIEDECKGMTSDECLEVRKNKSKPLLDELKLWLEQVRPTVPPSGLIGKAISYALNEWKYLSRYAEDGTVEIDNNFVENYIRPFALGRKNWLFSDSVDGAKASASLYGLVVTAKANGLEPYHYLRYVLEKLPRAKTLEDIEALLPNKAKSILLAHAVN